MKISVIGAGNVGASVAEYAAIKELADEIVLLDIKENFAEGKAMDINQCAALNGFNAKVTGSTNDYSATAGSSVVVITSGIPRKPGMTREELIGTNAGIVKQVTENVLKHSPETIVVVISNPMDTMTYLALKSSGLPKNRIIGMGGLLDSARFKYRLSEALNSNPNDVQGVVIGGHGDTTMIPLTRLATLNSTPVSNYLNADQLKKGERGNHGGRSDPHEIARHISLVCARSCRSRPGGGHSARSEKINALLRLPRRRIRSK